MNENQNNVKKILVIVGCGCIFVVGLFAAVIIFMAVFVVAINPSDELARARNVKRETDIRLISQAIVMYKAEHSADSFTSLNIPACSSKVADIGTGIDMVNLEIKLVPDYILEVPSDPSVTSGQSTGYTICKNPNDKILLAAPDAENSEVSLEF